MNGLDQQQWQALQASLELARLALQSQLASDLDAGPGPRLAPPHEAEASPADNASLRTLNALTQEAADHTARQLRNVRHALAKFADGSYGLCESCGAQIGYARLNARPEARLCIACQTRLEKRLRQEAHF